MSHLGDERRIPHLNISEADAGVIIGSPVLGLLSASLIGVESAALPLIVAGFGFGITVVYVTPGHLTAWTWLTDVFRYLKRPQTTFSAPADADNRPSIEANRGGLANKTPFRPDERTQELTNVERAWPSAAAIQRTDGTMETFVEVSPGNMDFAMATDWEQLQSACAEFANNDLDSPLKFHATTRSFPVDQLVDSVETRLDDDDVAENPILEELLEEYRETRPREMESRGVQQIRYYLGVQVSPIEVYDNSHDEKTPAEKLTQLPIIGFFFTPFVTRREDLTAAERRERMFETLDTRVTDLEATLIHRVSGWSARRLSTVELFMLNMDFWNGTEHNYDNPDRVIRDTPVVGDPEGKEVADD